MPVIRYYTQRVCGFQHESEKYTSESATFLLRRNKQRCPRRGSTDEGEPRVPRRILEELPKASVHAGAAGKAPPRAPRGKNVKGSRRSSWKSASAPTTATERCST